MLITADLLVLALDDTSGRAVASQNLDLLTGAGLVVDLALAEAIRIRQGRWKTWYVSVFDDARVDDPVLVDAVEVLSEKERALTSAFTLLGRQRPAVLARLAQHEILSEVRGKALGLFPTQRWPAVDGRHKAELVADIRAALGDGAAPSERTATLISLLNASSGLAPYAKFEHLKPKQVKARADEISSSSTVAAELRQVLEATAASIAMAGATAGAAGDGGGGG